MRERFGRAGQPVVAVSRGRVGDWYRSVTDRYVDVFDLMSEAQFQHRHRDRAAKQDDAMQGSLSEFERDVLRGVTERLGLQDPGLVHPSGLSWLWSKVARGKLPLSDITERALYRRLASPAAAGPLPGLPAEYVVAGCWFGSGFPNTPEHRAAIGALVLAASRRVPVVLLDAKGVPDEERGRWDGGSGVTPFDTFGLGEQRLPTLARVIAGARAFVGTFGGRSCLAPFLGVPSCTVHGELSGRAGLQAAVAAHAFASLEGGPAITRPSGEITQEAADGLIDRILGRGAE
jgi:hypothetical protein